MKKIKRNGYFWSGIGILVLLILLYFFKINVDAGGNYNVQDSLLGVIIFHNPFILAIYIVIAAFLTVKGLRKHS